MVLAIYQWIITDQNKSGIVKIEIDTQDPGGTQMFAIFSSHCPIFAT